MIVITLSECPPALRGDLTKWLQEINTGVYVGQVSARVRDELWNRIIENAKFGRATMVYSTQNEQKLDFRVHNTLWEPINFDGLKLMLRPSPARIKNLEAKRNGYSNAAKMRMAKKATRRNPQSTEQFPATYVVVDVQTTGPSTIEHEISQIRVLKVIENEVHEHFNRLVVSDNDTSRTSDLKKPISDQGNEEHAGELGEVVVEFLSFVESLPVVSINSEHEYMFLRFACTKLDLPLFSNKCIDVLKLAKRITPDIKNYKLQTLLDYFEIETSIMDLHVDACIRTHQLYQKLINFHSE